MKTAQFMMQSFDPIKSKALHTNRDIGKTHIKIHCNAAIVKWDDTETYIDTYASQQSFVCRSVVRL